MAATKYWTLFFVPFCQTLNPNIMGDLNVQGIFLPNNQVCREHVDILNIHICRRKKLGKCFSLKNNNTCTHSEFVLRQLGLGERQRLIFLKPFSMLNHLKTSSTSPLSHPFSSLDVSSSFNNSLSDLVSPTWLNFSAPAPVCQWALLVYEWQKRGKNWLCGIILFQSYLPRTKLKAKENVLQSNIWDGGSQVPQAWFTLDWLQLACSLVTCSPASSGGPHIHLLCSRNLSI